MTLPPQPEVPEGVRYALTLSRTVLQSDLRLRGNSGSAFTDVLNIDYQMPYLAFDDGQMSWNYSSDTAFYDALFGDRPIRLGVARFLAAMGTLARAMDRASVILADPANRLVGHPEHLLADLRAYWHLYEQYSITLFAFWNVEHVLVDALTAAAREADLTAEITDGFSRFFHTPEDNVYVLERRHLARIAERFLQPGQPAPTLQSVSPALREVLQAHLDCFDFMLAPFKIDGASSLESLLTRVAEARDGAPASITPFMHVTGGFLEGYPPDLQELGLLAQQLTFWRTERLDVMALGDARITPLYAEAAGQLGLSLEHLCAMTRDEIEASLLAGTAVVDRNVREQRLRAYCLILSGGTVAFYEPTPRIRPGADDAHATGGEQLTGNPASRGVVSGRVIVVHDLSDTDRLMPGDVLVTDMTRPEMGVALDRAVAFVTDEGGLMSHAAIIAREMGKPCVIATGNASHRLLDGMIVKVDGDVGLVTVEETP